MFASINQSNCFTALKATDSLSASKESFTYLKLRY